MTDIVLIHGTWHGAWCWDEIKSRLEPSGYRVHALTLPGLGERSNELQPDTNLKTHADDLEQQLAGRDWNDILLVAHSYAGMVVSWIAPRLVSYGVRRVVLLDAFVPMPGESAIDVNPDLRTRLMDGRMPNKPWALSPPEPAPGLFGIEDPDLVLDVVGRLTPMPLATHTQPIPRDAVWPEDLPVTYIRCLRHPTFAAMRPRVEDRREWVWMDLDAGHDAMLTHPDELGKLLQEQARNTTE